MSIDQNHTLIIVCSTDVVLLGISEIARNCEMTRLISVNQAGQLIDYPDLTGNLLVITTRELSQKHGVFLSQRFASATQVKTLFLNFDPLAPDTTDSINIYENQALLTYKINEHLQAFSQNGNAIESYELTKREIEVLQWVTKGLSNKEIADKLFVSIHTVISHRKNISEKTGIKSASGLTMYAVLKKIIDLDDIKTSDLI